MIAMDRKSFPAATQDIDASWHPIQIEPIPGSGERITIGVVVVSPHNTIVRAAPGLDRLKCLYGDDAAAVTEAASISVSALENWIVISPNCDPKDFRPPFLSVSVGAPRKASGKSIETIAAQAMLLSSSLCHAWSRGIQPLAKVFDAESTTTLSADARISDRITKAVRDIVVSRRPGLKEAFNVPIKALAAKRAPVIGFVSARLVSNFAAIRPNRVGDSVAKVRNSLWGLLLHRDLDMLTASADHRLFLMRPTNDDVHWTEKQIDDATEACEEIKYEAERERLNVDVHASVPDMADYVLSAA